MNAWVLIVWVLTASGLVEVRQPVQGGLQTQMVCEATAEHLRRAPRDALGENTVIIGAQCVREWSA